MSYTNQYQIVDYGFTQALQPIFPAPIVANRAPGTGDKAQIGTLWVQPVNTSGSAINGAWILTSIIANSATWEAVTGAGGSFSSLTVSPGPINFTGVLTQLGTANINATGTAATSIGNATGALTLLGPTSLTGTFTQVGTTLINASGAAVTTIGTGGTGAVNIGNATGNTAVTGSLSTTTSLSATTSVTAGTSITATLGNITATNGNVVLSTAATYVQLPGPIKIMSGAGAPSNGLAAEAGDLYINTTGSTTSTRLYIATGAGAWTYIASNA